MVMATMMMTMTVTVTIEMTTTMTMTMTMMVMVIMMTMRVVSGLLLMFLSGGAARGPQTCTAKPNSSGYPD